MRCLLGTYVVGVFEVQTRDDNPRTLEKAAEKGSFDRSPVGGTPREMKRIYWTTKGGRIAYCACSSLGGGGGRLAGQVSGGHPRSGLPFDVKFLRLFSIPRPRAQ